MAAVLDYENRRFRCNLALHEVDELLTGMHAELRVDVLGVSGRCLD